MIFRSEVETTYSNEDTLNLLAAINNGKGLKIVAPVAAARQSPVPVQMHNIKEYQFISLALRIIFSPPMTHIEIAYFTDVL